MTYEQWLELKDKENTLWELAIFTEGRIMPVVVGQVIAEQMEEALEWLREIYKEEEIKIYQKDSFGWLRDKSGNRFEIKEV